MTTSRAEKAKHALDRSQVVLENLRFQIRQAMKNEEFYWNMEKQNHLGSWPWDRIWNFAVIVNNKLEWVVPDPIPHADRGVLPPPGWEYEKKDYDAAYKEMGYSGSGPCWRFKGGSTHEMWCWIVDKAELPEEEAAIAKQLKDIRMRRMG